MPSFLLIFLKTCFECPVFSGTGKSLDSQPDQNLCTNKQTNKKGQEKKYISEKKK